MPQHRLTGLPSLPPTSPTGKAPPTQAARSPPKNCSFYKSSNIPGCGLRPHLKADGYREQSAAACPEVETPGYEKQRFQIVFACLQKLLEDGGVTKETNKASLTTFSTTPRGGPGDVNRASPSPLRSRKTHAETW